MARTLDPSSDRTSTVDVNGPFAHFALLASALAGCLLDVHPTDRSLAYTDGEAIYVPSGDDDDSIAVAIVVQSTLISVGSLDRQVVAHLVGRRSLARRYLTCEAARAMTRRSSVAPARVARLVEGHWGGRISASPQESLERARSREEIPEAPEMFGAIRPATLRGVGGRARGGAPSELDQQGKTTLSPTPETDDEDETDSINFMKALATPLNVFGDNPLMKWMKRTLGVGSRAAPDGGTAGGEMPAGSVSWGDESAAPARPVLAVAGLHQRVPDGPPGRRLYPEWDCRESRYRPAFCQVRELDPVLGADLILPSTDRALRGEISRLGLDYERHRHQLEGPDLDLTAAVDFAVARARGEESDGRVYQVRLKTARDLAVLVLLDASGSTGDERAGRAIFDEECQVVVDLVDVLAAVGDRVGAYAFDSAGPSSIRFLRIKEFDDLLDATALARLAGVRPTGNTRLGAAIRHATHVVTTRGGAANKLLVVVSDGLPYDHGYEASYGEQDTRRALSEAVGAGVGCLCLSLGEAKGDEALQRMWGSASHVRLGEPGELGAAIGPLLRSAMVAAAKRGGQPSDPVSWSPA
jgi:hypothetical protein